MTAIIFKGTRDVNITLDTPNSSLDCTFEVREMMYKDGTVDVADYKVIYARLSDRSDKCLEWRYGDSSMPQRIAEILISRNVEVYRQIRQEVRR